MDTCHIRRPANAIADLTPDGTHGTHHVQIPGTVQLQRTSQPNDTATSRAGFGSGIGSRNVRAALNSSAGKQ